MYTLNVWNYSVVQTWKGTTLTLTMDKTLITSVCISGDFDTFVIIASQISPQRINKTALHVSTSSQTNAGALWFMRCIGLLYVTDAFWLFIERSTVGELSSPSVFRHFGSMRRKIPEVKLAIVNSHHMVVWFKTLSVQVVTAIAVTKLYLQLKHNIGGKVLGLSIVHSTQQLPGQISLIAF